MNRSAALLALLLVGAQAPPAPDRVGLPRYDQGFAHIRSFHAAPRGRIGLVYANEAAASVADLGALPYPYGAIFVVEWRRVLADTNGARLRDENGDVRGAEVVQIDVMRRERGFGAGYGADRAGEWEFVSYLPDGRHFVAPAESGQCAACHLTAGAARDFVFRGRFPPASDTSMSGN